MFKSYPIIINVPDDVWCNYHYKSYNETEREYFVFGKNITFDRGKIAISFGSFFIFIFNLISNNLYYHFKFNNVANIINFL